MLIYVHRPWVPSGITARKIVPHTSCARCKPDVKGVEEDAVGIIWVNRNALIVPVLGIIETTVTERAALRAFHISPARPAIRASPRTKLATVGITTPTVVIPNNGLRLRVNVIRIARRHCDVDASKLVGAAITGSSPTGNRIITRRTAAGIHRRTCRVRAARHLVTEDKPVTITGNRCEARAAALSHRGAVDTVCSIVAQIILHVCWESACTDRSDDSSIASAEIS